MMLSSAALFLVAAIIAGVFGFGGIAGAGSWIAQIIFILLLAVFIVSACASRKPPVT